jgi:hypothetical protein
LQLIKDKVILGKRSMPELAGKNAKVYGIAFAKQK